MDGKKIRPKKKNGGDGASENGGGSKNGGGSQASHGSGVSGTSSKGNGGLLGMADYLYTAQDMIFGVVFLMMKETERRKWVAIGEIVAFNLWYLFFPLTVFSYGRGVAGSAFVSLGEAMSYPRLRYWDYTDFSVVYWVSVVLVLLITANLGFVTWIFQRQKFRFKDPIVYLRYWANAATSWLAAPILIILSQAYNCPLSGRHVNFPQLECWSMAHLPLVVISAAASLALIVFTLSMAVFYYEPDPRKTFVFTARPHTRADFIAQAALFVMCIEYSISTLPQWVYGATYLLAGLLSLWSMLGMFPYYCQWVNLTRIGVASAFTWCSILVLVESQYGEVAGTNMTVAFILGGLAAPALGVLFARWRFRARYCTGSLDGLELKKPWHVELGTRFLLEDRSQRSLELAEDIFLEGVDRYQTSANVYVCYSNYLYWARGSEQLAFDKARQAAKLKPLPDHAFYIYCKMNQRTQSMQGGGAKGGAASDMLSFIEFQKNFSGAKKYHRHAVRAFKKFWMLLLTEETDMRQLESAVSRIDRFESRAQTFYRNLLSKHPNNPRILRAYGKFHEEVLNDVLSAQDFYDAADEFEDANVVAAVDPEDEEEDDMDHEIGVVTTQKVVGNIFEQARAEQSAVTVVSKGGAAPVRSALKGGRADVAQIGGWAADTTFDVPDPNLANQKKPAKEPKDPMASARRAKEGGHTDRTGGKDGHMTARGEHEHGSGNATARGEHTSRTAHHTHREHKEDDHKHKEKEEHHKKKKAVESDIELRDASDGEKGADEAGIDLMHGFDGVGGDKAPRRKVPTSTQQLITEARVELAASEESRVLSAQGGPRRAGGSARNSPRRLSAQGGEGLKTTIVFDADLLVQDTDMYFSVVFGHDDDVRGRPLANFLPAMRGAAGGLPGAIGGGSPAKRPLSSVLGEDAFEGSALKNTLARREDGSAFLASLEATEIEVGDARLYQVTVRRAEAAGSRPGSRSPAGGGPVLALGGPAAPLAAPALLAVPEHSRPGSAASEEPHADPPQWATLQPQRPSVAASENGLESLLADLRAGSDAASGGGGAAPHVLSKWGFDEEEEEEDSGAGTGTGQDSAGSRDSTGQDIVVNLNESVGLKQRKGKRPGSSGSDASFKKPSPADAPPSVGKPTAAALAALAGGEKPAKKAKGSDAGGSDDDEHAEGKGKGSDAGDEKYSDEGSEDRAPSDAAGEEQQQRAKRRLKKLNALKRRVASAHSTHNTAIKRMRRVVYLVLFVLAGAALLGYFFIKTLLDTYMQGIQLVGDTGGRRRTGNMAVFALRSILLSGHPAWDPQNTWLDEWSPQLEANLDKLEENHLTLSDFYTAQDFSVRRVLSDAGETGMTVDDMWNAGFEIVDAGRRAMDRIKSEGLAAVRKNAVGPQAGLDDPDIYFVLNNTIERIRLKFIEAADKTVDKAEALFSNIRMFLYIEICLVTVLISVLALGFFRPTILRVQAEKERALLLFYEIPRATVARMAGLGKKTGDDEDEEDMDDDDFDDDFDEMDQGKAAQGKDGEKKEGKERSGEDKAKHIRERMAARKKGVDPVTIRYTTAFLALFFVFLAWFVVSYVYSARCFSFARERNLSGLRRSTPVAMQYYARELILDPSAYEFNLGLLKKHTEETAELERGILYGDAHLQLPGSAMRYKPQDDLMFGKPCASDPKGCTNTADNGVHRLLMRYVQEATFIIDSPRELLTANNSHYKYLHDTGLHDLDKGLANSVTLYEEEAHKTVGDFLVYHQLMVGLTFLTIILSYLLVFRAIVSSLNDESRRTTFLMLMVPPEVIESCDSIRAYLLSRM